MVIADWPRAHPVSVPGPAPWGVTTVCHTVWMDEDVLSRLDRLAEFLAHKIDDDPERAAVVMVQAVFDELGDGQPEIHSLPTAITFMNIASVVVNAASRMSDVELLELGEAWMTSATLSDPLLSSPHAARARYNLANSQLATLNARIALEVGAGHEASTMAGLRWDQRDQLRRVRSGFAAAAALDDSGRTKGMALCNLANTLDQSGRWIEAYDAYVRALKADPTNGNAAGNAAVLIERAIQRGWDFEGHLCSLYDHYLTMAKDNRERTVEVAGEGAAERFDRMELLGSHEPLEQSDPRNDKYQEWVVEHRLALAASLEGVGVSDHEARWDTASVRQVTTPATQEAVPTIFSLINLLKADFLVARRLTYDTREKIRATDDGWQQDPSDPGVYVDTADYAMPGTLASSLVLAHRAAIDMLDKTAVAMNEHLGIGDDPQYVTFRRFWTKTVKGGSIVLRPELIEKPHLSFATLALAELAHDMVEEGMYAHAQEVRHAGTHRFVLLHHGTRDLKSTGTTQTLTLDHMIETTMQALSVARAAFLYLVSAIDTDESFNQNKSDSMTAKIPLFSTEWL